ncbi:hypothetical protein FXO37_04437 [Capsicum annuum]|nr:hypothetical protein FXO37_04437 [Capsicum annuum]
MTLEVKDCSSSRIVICANGISLNFTPRKFVIVTGLNCVSNRYEFVFDEGVPNRIVEKYFNRAEIIQKRQLFLAFTEKVWGENNDEDATILYFLHSFVLSNIETVVIPHLHFDLVESRRYKNFSGGTLSFEDLARSLNKRLKPGGKFYLIQGMPLAIQVWIYECCSNVPPKIVSKEEVVSKSERHVEKEAFISKKVFNAFRDEQQYEEKDLEPQHMNYVGAETSPQHFSLNVYQNLGENQDGTKINDKKIDETKLSDSQFTIPDELLPSLNIYRRKSITTHPSTTCEEELTDEHLNDKKSESIVEDHCQVDLGTGEEITTPPKIQEVTTDEQRDDPVWPDSQKTIPDELFPSLNACSSKSIIVHPSANRELQTVVQKIRIRRSSKFKESPYTMKFGSAAGSAAGHIRIFPQKYPFVYHPIDGIVDTKIVKKFKQIDVCFYYLRKKLKYDPNRSYKFNTVDCKFMNDKKGIDLQNYPRYKDKDSSNMFDVLFEENLPQQLSKSLDCGVYMVTYAECLSYGHKIFSTDFVPNALHTRYEALLKDYGIRK